MSLSAWEGRVTVAYLGHVEGAAFGCPFPYVSNTFLPPGWKPVLLFLDELGIVLEDNVPKHLAAPVDPRADRPDRRVLPIGDFRVAELIGIAELDGWSI